MYIRRWRAVALLPLLLIIITTIAVAATIISWNMSQVIPSVTHSPSLPSGSFLKAGPETPAASGNCAIPYSGETNITDPRHPLALKSKEAILNSGISQSYFTDHFTFLCAVADYGSHREVRWQYVIAGYTIVLSDVIGYSEGIDIHGITTTLHGFIEIQRVIPEDAAKQVLQSCIGEFDNLQAIFVGGERGQAK